MLCHFHDQGLSLIFGCDGVHDRWQIAVEMYVNDGAGDLGHFAYEDFCHGVTPDSN